MLSLVDNFSVKVDQLTDVLGRSIAWCAFLMVINMTAVVVLRHVFNVGWIWLQESVLYLHAILFMLAMPYTLKADGHVRVDIFYRKFSVNHKNRVNLFGHIFLLLPTCVFLLNMSWNYVVQSWSVFEGSKEAGGLPLVFILKTLLIVMPVLLILQALSDVIKIFLKKTTNVEGGNS